MRRNITIWLDERNQYVIDFSIDLVTRAIWVTGPGLDFTTVTMKWIHEGILPMNPEVHHFVFPRDI